MLFLKAFCCVVICFGIVQTKCIENQLLEKVLGSNISNTEKLEEINKIVLNGLLRQDNLDASLPNKLIQPDPVLIPPIYQLPESQTSELWNPWSNLDKTDRNPDILTRRTTKPSVAWNPFSALGLGNLWARSKPSVAWNPFEALRRRQQNSEPTRYQPSLWNQLDPAESQLNSFRILYPNQINGDGSLINLKEAMNSHDRLVPYYDDYQPDMSPAGSLQNKVQSSAPSENNPSMSENGPYKYNILKN